MMKINNEISTKKLKTKKKALIVYGLRYIFIISNLVKKDFKRGSD